MAAPELLRLFPLSNVVLFPRVKTPLHLFEPRYRQLAREALDGDRRIGMALVRPEHTDEMGGDPPIFAIGCAGSITESQRLPDGRYNIVLQGEERVRILEESPPEGERLYRVAQVQRLEDGYPESERAKVAQLRHAIVQDVTLLVRRTQPTDAGGLAPEIFADVDDETFVNAVSNALALDPLEKQGLLEADDIPERYARLANALSFRRAQLEAVQGGPPRKLH